MNMATILFTAALLIISFTVTYFCWMQVRVMRLQTDIEEISDRLFDDALSVKGLNDPAYQSARSYLNGLIAQAGDFSVALWLMGMLHLLKRGESLFHEVPFHTENEELHAAIARAMHSVLMRMLGYVMDETAIGWMTRVTVTVFGPWLPKIGEEQNKSVRPTAFAAMREIMRLRKTACP